MVSRSSFPKLLREHWVVALLIAIFATETLVFVIVLLAMANKSTQSFPAFALLVGFGPAILGFRE